MFEELFSKRMGLIKPGLERIRRAYDELGRPGHGTPTVLVAGTNGKGTTASLLWQLLKDSGIRCGLFTSPHLIRFNERFLHSSEDWNDDHIAAALSEIRSRLNKDAYDELSFFELSTLIALVLMEEAQTSWRILEVGLGGRLDSTNLIDADISLITSIGMDHCEYLGDSLVGIAGEKAGIFRPGQLSLWGPLQPEVLAMLEERAIRLGLRHHRLGLDYGVRNGRIWCGREEWDAPKYFEGRPRHSLEQYALALATSRFIRESIVPHEISQELPAPMRARTQWLHVDCKDGSRQSLLLDVAHNVDGIEALIAFLRSQDLLGIRVMVCVLKDKQSNEMLDLLRRYLPDVVLFNVSNDRSWTEEDLAERHRDLRFYASFRQAWQGECSSSGRRQPWLVCGSVAALGEVLAELSEDRVVQSGDDYCLLGREPTSLVTGRHAATSCPRSL